MASHNSISLGVLRERAKQESNQENSQFLSTQEWNANISASYKELYDLLVTSYGNEYEVAAAYQFATVGLQQDYALPDDFYKLLGVDLKVSSTPDSWITLRKFQFTERNKYQLSNQWAYLGVTSLMYRLVGNNLKLTPIPTTGQDMQIWYIPTPANLQIQCMAQVTMDSPIITISATFVDQLTIGMQVINDFFPANTTVLSTDLTLNQVTLSNNAMATSTSSLISLYDDSTEIDGISGFEEYIIVDAAIKAMGKEESDPSLLLARKEALKIRITETAENRDAGLPDRVTDTQSTENAFPGGWGGSGNGGWGGF